jgi:hypothetical protein
LQNTILLLIILFVFIAYAFYVIKNPNSIGQTNGSTEIDTFGSIISTIDFTVKASGDDLIDFEEGVIPWISIDNPKSKINNLIDADSIVLDYTSVTLVIEYPLEIPAIFNIQSFGKGFSRRQLVLVISEKYHEIYALEESTANVKTIPAEKREGAINRNQTDGKYGIWGHDISDLVLSSIEVYKNSKGQITLMLIVQS